MSKNCANCGEDLRGNYCSNCSQSAHVGQIDLHEIVHEFMHGVLHVDKGILYTAKELTLRPGQTIRNYLSGKRVNYFKPLAYLFLLSTIYIILIQFSNISLTKELVQVHLNDDVNEEIVATIDKQIEATNALFEFLINRFAIMNLLMLPVIALLSYICFRKQKYNYGEHLIINSYVSGHIILVNFITIALACFIPNSFSFLTILTYVFYVYMYVNIFNSYKLLSATLRSVVLVLGLILIIALAFIVYSILFLIS